MNTTSRAIVGIDLALTSQHRAVILSQEDTHHRSVTFAHTFSDFEKLTAMVEKNAALSNSVFLMEPTGKLWTTLAAFLKAKGAAVIAVKPSLSSKFRKVVSTYAKSDRIDALSLARLQLTLPQVLNPVYLPSPDCTLLRVLCNERLDRVEQAVILKAKIGEYVRVIYPGIAEKVKPAQLLENQWRPFLKHYLVPQKAAKLGLAGFVAFLQKNTRAKLDQKAYKLFFYHIEQSAKLFSELETFHCEPFRCADIQEIVKRSIKQLELLEKEIKELDKQIEQRYHTYDPLHLLEQLPGIGKILAPSLLANIGDIRRFKNQDKFKCYCGLTPKSKRSSKTVIHGLEITKSAHKLLKRDLFLAAKSAIFWDPELTAFAIRLLSRGKHFFKVLTAVAGKIADRIYCLLKKAANGLTPSFQFRDESGNTIDKKTAAIRALALWHAFKETQEKNKKGGAMTPLNEPLF